MSTKCKVVFLDRDGTIAEDVPYCRRVEDFKLLKNVSQGIKLLNEHGFKVVVITNQSGIARGYFTEEILSAIHNKMRQELAKFGAGVDAIYHCPHHPDDGCDCRKPNTALFLQAAKELDIDLSNSFMIGDTELDIAAGKSLGSRAILVTTGPNKGSDVTSSPDYTADSLLEAAQWVVKEAKSEPKPSTSIIVPAYNEEDGLLVVLGKIFKVIDNSYEVIVVDDGSTDATGQVASQFPCRLIRHEVNKGKGEALRTGIKQARGENVIWIDADDTYPAELIPQMAQSLKSYDMVVGSRLSGKVNIPTFNRVGNWLFRNMIKRIYGFKPADTCTGLYGVKKRYLEMMGLSSRRFAIEPEISIKGSRMGLKMLDMPIEYQPRIGQAKLHGLKAGFENLITILSLLFWKSKAVRHSRRGKS